MASSPSLMDAAAMAGMIKGYLDMVHLSLPHATADLLCALGVLLKTPTLSQQHVLASCSTNPAGTRYLIQFAFETVKTADLLTGDTVAAVNLITSTVTNLLRVLSVLPVIEAVPTPPQGPPPTKKRSRVEEANSTDDVLVVKKIKKDLADTRCSGHRMYYMVRAVGQLIFKKFFEDINRVELYKVILKREKLMSNLMQCICGTVSKIVKSGMPKSNKVGHYRFGDIETAFNRLLFNSDTMFLFKEHMSENDMNYITANLHKFEGAEYRSRLLRKYMAEKMIQDSTKVNDYNFVDISHPSSVGSVMKPVMAAVVQQQQQVDKV